MIKMEIQTDKRLITSIGNYKNNVEVKIGDGFLQLKIDKKNLFNTLKHRKVIVGLLNKKLDELVEEHLNSMTIKENERNKDL